MESLIILIIFLLVSSIGGNRKKRRPNNANRQGQPSAQQTLTRQVRQLVDGMIQNEASSQQPVGRRSRSSAVRAEQECGYCTGEVAVEQTLAHSSGAAPLRAIVPQTDQPLVDVAAIQKEMGLSDLQNMILWQELLGKPPALRNRRR